MQSLQNDDWLVSQKHTLEIKDQADSFEWVQVFKRIFNNRSPEEFKAQFEFTTDYHRQQFLKFYLLQKSIENEEIINEKSNRNDKYISRMIEKNKPKDLTKAQVLIWQNAIRVHIFMKAFSQEIINMENEFNYKIFANGRNIKVYMKDDEKELSKMFINTLCHLQKKLGFYNCKLANVLERIQYSKIFKEKLKNLKIETAIIFFQGKDTVTFYSTQKKFREIQKTVIEEINNDAAYVTFENPQLSQVQNTCIFHLISKCLAKKIDSMRNQYSIEIQQNKDKFAYILHTRHSIFAVEPLKDIEKELKFIKILSLKMKNIRTFNNFLKKNIKNYKFASQYSERRKTFLAIDLRVLKNSEELFELLKIFLNEIGTDIEIEIYLLKFVEEEVESIIELASNEKLQIVNYQSLMENQEKVIKLKLKNYSESMRTKKQKEVFDFILSYINLREDQKLTKMTEEQLEISLNSDLSKSMSKSAYGFQIEESALNKSLMERRYFDLAYQKPKEKHFEADENNTFVKSMKRVTSLENQFKTKFSPFIFKVWSMEISDKIKIPDVEDPRPYLAKNVFVNGKLNPNIETINFNSIQIDEEAFIVYMSTVGQYVPTHYFKRIA